MPIPLGILAVAGAGAAGGGGAFDLLETTVLGSDTASVTFSNLNTYSAYKHLQIRLVARSTNASASRSVRIQFNGDTASNYAYHYLLGDGSSVSSDASTSQTSTAHGRIEGNTRVSPRGPLERKVRPELRTPSPRGK